MSHSEIISHCKQTSKRFIAEFEPQSFIQIIFPHQNTDWRDYLDEAKQTFINIAQTISRYEKCVIVCNSIEQTKQNFTNKTNLEFIQYETDDTWARDCSAISILDNGHIKLLNFTFNGWGGKFDASKDDKMSESIADFYENKMINIDFVLEGGGIESNGEGLLLTTSKCMLSRNKNFDKNGTTQFLKSTFGAHDVLYLDYGYLVGDDTDSHIDTLARFVNKKTIMYVTCEDEKDEHYNELKQMQNQLTTFAGKYNLNLIPLPMPEAVYYDNERLPATYANFLMINGAVLVPVYNVKQDNEAIKIFKNFFPNRDIVSIDCSVLIRQHGSLHCVSMQFAKTVSLSRL